MAKIYGNTIATTIDIDKVGSGGSGSGVGQTTPDNGEIFNDYEHNIALAEYAHAEGKNTRVGHKGYKIKEILSLEEPDEKIFIICLNDKDLQESERAMNTYAVGDLINFDGASHHPEQLRICELYLDSRATPYTVMRVEIITESSLTSADFKMESPDNEYENWVNVTNKNVGENIPLFYAGHTEGENTVVKARSGHAEGRNTKVISGHGHSEGKNTTAGYAAHSEGDNTYAVGDSSHAEGKKNKVYSEAGHAEGKENIVTAIGGHAEGGKNIVSGKFAHAEGCNTEALGYASHSEGDDTTAEGIQCHSEGYKTIAKVGASHSEGAGTIANCYAQHVQGKYNIEDKNKKYVHIVGNGADENNRSNAHTIDWNGNAWFAGDVKAGTTSLQDIKYSIEGAQERLWDLEQFTQDIQDTLAEVLEIQKEHPNDYIIDADIVYPNPDDDIFQPS